MHGQVELFTIYTGKPFVSQFGQLVSKIPYCDFPFGRAMAFTICTNPSHLQRESGTGINKMWLDKMKHEFRWNISSGKTGLPFQTFRHSRKFSIRTTRKAVFHLSN